MPLPRRRALALLGGLVLAGAVGGRNTQPAPHFRRPSALAVTADGRWLFTANRKSGTVSVIDATALRPVAEVEAGRGLADLALTPDGRHLLAADEAGDALVLLARDGSTLRVERRILIPSPVCVRVAPDGTRAFVASLWAHQLAIVDLNGADARPRTVDLPFPPRLLLPVKDAAKVIVADAFGGRIAVVDAASAAVTSVRELPAHNIRGLALSADGRDVLLTHQILDGRTPTTLDNVFWGNLMTNNLRALPLADLLAPDADPLRGGHLSYLGDVNAGAGDPAGLAVAGDGTTVIALAGTGEVVIGDTRLRAGKRPTAVALAPDGRRAFVANTLADSIMVVDLPGRKVEAEVSLGPTPEPGPVERGEALFFDAKLSKDGWMSCQSCHPDGHANGRLSDTLGDGSYGTPKRVLSLLGTRDTAPWAWDGSQPELEGQVRKTLVTTMRGPEPSDDRVRDLAAFLRSLPPAPPLVREPTDAVRRGREVFGRQGCAECHAPPAYTSAGRYDVGLADEAGVTAFNPPSLRGVAHGGPYFHDGRAATLEEVFGRYRHRLRQPATERELADLIGFLRSL